MKKKPLSKKEAQEKARARKPLQPKQLIIRLAGLLAKDVRRVNLERGLQRILINQLSSLLTQVDHKLVAQGLQPSGTYWCYYPNPGGGFNRICTTPGNCFLLRGMTDGAC